MRGKKGLKKTPTLGASRQAQNPHVKAKTPTSSLKKNNALGRQPGCGLPASKRTAENAAKVTPSKPPKQACPKWAIAPPHVAERVLLWRSQVTRGVKSIELDLGMKPLCVVMVRLAPLQRAAKRSAAREEWRAQADSGEFGTRSAYWADENIFYFCALNGGNRNLAV